MKEKKRLLPVYLLIGLVLLLAAAFAYMVTHSLGFSAGRCLMSDNGTYMLILGNSPIQMSNRTGRDNPFSHLETGDRILVLHDGIQETYPGKTGVYGIIKLGSGQPDDIPETVLEQLTELGWLEAAGSETAGSTSPSGTSSLSKTEVYSAVSYANYYEGEPLYFSALNRDKMYISSVQHLPIFKFETLAELNLFRETFQDSLTMTHGYDEVPSFDSVTLNMDDAFFSETSLFLVYVPASSGSYRFALNSVYNDGKNLCIHVERTNDPKVVTDDMAGWFITVPLPKQDVASCVSFDADLNNLNT